MRHAGITVGGVCPEHTLPHTAALFIQNISRWYFFQSAQPVQRYHGFGGGGACGLAKPGALRWVGNF